jgi:hypothetical protein
MAQKYNISAITRHIDNTIINNDDILFDIMQINKHLINSVKVSHCDTNTSYQLNISSVNKVKEDTTMVKTLELSSTDLPLTSTFQSSDRHSDVSPEDISKRWFITIKTAK